MSHTQTPAASNSPDTLRTRLSLLRNVREGDKEAVGEFYRVYAKFIRSFGRKWGLQEDECHDLLQDTVLSIRDCIKAYKPEKKRKFRTWLAQKVRWRVMDKLREIQRDPLRNLAESADRSDDETSRTSTTDRIADRNEVDLARTIDQEWQRALVKAAVAARSVRLDWLQAYELREIRKMPPKEVARLLGVTQVTARVWSYRAKKAIQREIKQILKEGSRPDDGDARKPAS